MVFFILPSLAYLFDARNKIERLDIEFYDACAKKTNAEETRDIFKDRIADTRLFVFDTSTPSIYSDVAFGAMLKEKYPDVFVLLVGTHPSATVHDARHR